MHLERNRKHCGSMTSANQVLLFKKRATNKSTYLKKGREQFDDVRSPQTVGPKQLKWDSASSCPLCSWSRRMAGSVRAFQERIKRACAVDELVLFNRWFEAVYCSRIPVLMYQIVILFIGWSAFFGFVHPVFAQSTLFFFLWEWETSARVLKKTIVFFGAM